MYNNKLTYNSDKVETTSELCLILFGRGFLWQGKRIHN